MTDTDERTKSTSSGDRVERKATGKRKKNMNADTLPVSGNEVFGRSFIYNRSTSDFSITDHAGKRHAEEQDSGSLPPVNPKMQSNTKIALHPRGGAD